jgi:two-component system phosphate regulon response regulator PhoB
VQTGPYRLPDLGGINVLIVDDLLEDRSMVAAVLELAGAAVFELSLAMEAKATIRHLRPDVVITEMALADATGVDLARWIRSYDQTRQGGTVVIALTRWVAEYPCEVAREAGFDGYFTKPPTTDDLVVALAALLRTPSKSR